MSETDQPATAGAEEPKPKLRAQVLSDREVDALEDYQTKIRALRDSYLSFELAIEDARKQLQALTVEIESKQSALKQQEQAALAPLEADKANLTIEKNRLSEDVLQLQGEVARLQQEADRLRVLHQDKGKELADLDRDLRGGLAELVVKERKLEEQRQQLLNREGELSRLKESYEEIQAHTNEVEARIVLKQAQLDQTLDQIKANRLAEIQAKQEAEDAKRKMEVAQTELLIAQRERDELRRKQQEAEAKYQGSVELHDQATTLEQTNKIKEIALRDVQSKLDMEKYQLRQAQSKFLEEVAAHRAQCEACAAKASAPAPAGGTT